MINCTNRFLTKILYQIILQKQDLINDNHVLGGPISGVHMGTDMTDNIAFPKTTHVESKIN